MDSLSGQTVLSPVARLERGEDAAKSQIPGYIVVGAMLRREKQIVRDFYDSFGWQEVEAGVYGDTVLFVDPRPVLHTYDRRTGGRVKRFLAMHGRWFLDAGSGPIPYRGYLEYSEGFDFRVCVDLSLVALTKARAKLGPRGRYVLADLTRLPFRDGIFSATVALHVLYHLPADEQEAAVFELYRTLAPSACCVIIYSRPDCALAALARLSLRLRGLAAHVPGARRLWRALTHRASRSMAPSPTALRDERPLYFYAHEYTWFRKTLPVEWDIEVRCWRALDRFSTDCFVADNLLGRVLLALVSWCETTFPHALVRLGRYPMIVLRKG